MEYKSYKDFIDNFRLKERWKVLSDNYQNFNVASKFVDRQQMPHQLELNIWKKKI